jgi:hypothetical protein
MALDTAIYAIQNLEAKNMIKVERHKVDNTSEVNIISFQKDYEYWVVQENDGSARKCKSYKATIEKQKSNYKSRVVQENDGSARNQERVVQENVNDIRFLAPTKETIQKKKEERKEDEKTLPEKKLFGHLLLTEDEHEKLKVKYNSHFQELLDYMNLKIESKGIKKWRKEYESDYATIGVWERKGYFPEKIKVAEQKPAQPQKDTPKKTEVFEHEDPDPEKIKQVNNLVDNLASQMGVVYKR